MTGIHTMFCLISIPILFIALQTAAGDFADISLPAPRTEGGKPLMQALKDRQSGREFSSKKLPVQVLSDLLWAANGINRSESSKRTAPSARNWQEVALYIVLEDGAYLYDAKANTLKAVAAGDLRRLTGKQKFVSDAPLNLVFVADLSKMQGASSDEQALYSATDAAFISENVYLFCASEGLATVVRGSIDRSVLKKALKLSENQKIILAQTVGYPGTTDK
jgi:nitroreductase